MLATQDPEVVAFSKPQKLMYDRLARNLRVREQLILKVAQAIAAVQHDYFSQLSDSKVPLLLKQVAEITGLPEPVVNLLVSNKNMGFGQWYRWHGYFGARQETRAARWRFRFG